ncbi:MAG: MFS transporter [Cytophagales bacterium]|nr:MFS transporter [Cytophagales bacterium]
MREQDEGFRHKPMYVFLLLLTFAVAVSFQGWRILFNNFAVEELGLNGLTLGAVQSVREVPGFLALLVVFLLLFVREHKLASFSVVLMGLGIVLTGLFPTFWGLMFTTFLMSVGFHYFETTNQSLTLQYFNWQDAPVVLARFRSIGALSNIVVGGLLFLSAQWLDYEWNYLLVGAVAALCGIGSMFLKPDRQESEPQYKHMVFRKKYWLFYVLNFLSGSRRQIFIVFAVLLLVERFQYSIEEIAVLFVVNNIMSIIFNPMIARGIKRFGEKKVLTMEYLSLAVIFTAYAYAETKWQVAVLYILDHIFFNFSIGIKTYFQKNADPKDIAPSMAVGFTVNHIAAVVIPFVGGYLWLQNWRLPFWGGVALCLISLGFVQKMKPVPEVVREKRPV